MGRPFLFPPLIRILTMAKAKGDTAETAPDVVTAPSADLTPPPAPVIDTTPAKPEPKQKPKTEPAVPAPVVEPASAPAPAVLPLPIPAPAPPAPPVVPDVVPPAPVPVIGKRRFEVFMQEMGVHVVPTVVEADDKYEAVVEYKRLCGIIETPHTPSVREVSPDTKLGPVAR